MRCCSAASGLISAAPNGARCQPTNEDHVLPLWPPGLCAVISYALSGEEKKARGCDDYVPKPFSPRQLLAKIGNICPKAVVSETRDQSRQKALNRSGASAV
jgi:CheY-like chemotaxis protein